MTEFVAEAGVNHGGMIGLALKMVDAAKAAGADVVKFQTYSPKHAIHPKHPDFGLLSTLALPHDAFRQVSRHCENIGIEFMSTPGDVYSLEFLTGETSIKRIKIGSDDLNYTPLLEAAAKTMLPLIVSTGMANQMDIIHALDTLRNVTNITLLHCTSSYPCADRDVNLKAMDTIRKFGLPVGFSDHTKGVMAALAAAARGAVLIEKHFMLAEFPGAVDSTVSINEHKMATLIKNIRVIESMLGNGVKEPTQEELKNKPLFVKDANGLKRGEMA